MHPFLKLIRLPNCIMMGVAVITGIVIASKGNIVNIDVPQIIIGFLAGFFLTGFSMIFNDYWDREIDAINDPTRPIPSGKIKPREAIIYASIFFSLGIILSLTINEYCLIMAILFSTISILYTTWGKRTGLLGNLMVSSCVVAPFLYGGAIVQKIDFVLWIFILMVFLSNTAREITKGIVDIEGDRTYGVETIAVRYGAKVAAFISAILYLSAISLSLLPILWKLVSIGYVILVIVADVGFIYSTIFLLKNPNKENAKKAKNEVLVWMFLGLLAFLLGMFKF